MNEIIFGVFFFLSIFWVGGVLAITLQPRWGWMVASIGSLLILAGLVIFLVQFLSLVSWLTPVGLALSSFGTALATRVVCGTISKSANPLSLFGAFPQVLKAWLQASFTWSACAVGITLLASMILLLGFGLDIHPIGDSYHFTRPLYWLQHSTIAHFPAENYRINALSPGADILSLPLQMYFGITSTRILLAPVCLLMLVPLTQRLCVQLGVSPKIGLLASLVCISGSILLNGILYGWLDLLLPGACLALSVVLLLASRKKDGQLDPLNLGFSVLFFVMAVGLKNLLAFATPGYGLLLLSTHGWRWLQSHALIAGTAGALAGVILSAFAWNYASNLSFYGRLTGPPALASDSLAPTNIPDVSTRIARGLVQVFDITYTPGFLEQRHREFNAGLCHILGASRVLEGESPNTDRSFNFRDTQNRKGFGWPGILLFIAASWTVASFLFKPSTLHRRESRQVLALVALLVIHFILVHGLVVWMDYGRLRFMAPTLFVLAPAIAPLLQWRWATNLVATVVVLHTGLLLLKSAVVTYRYKESANPIASALLKKLGSPPGDAKHTYHLVTPTQQIKPYTTFRKSGIYQIAASVIDMGSNIGLVTTRNSQEQFLFGKPVTHRVLPLIPTDPDLLTKKNQCQFIVIEPNSQNLSTAPDIVAGFSQTHKLVDSAEHIMLEIWQRNPQ